MFEYIYYRIYSTYKYKWKENMPGVYAVGAVSVLQISNISSLIITTKLFFGYNLQYDYFHEGIFGIILLIFNYFRFASSSQYTNYEKKWKGEKSFIKKVRGILIIIYMVLSILGFLLLVKIMHRHS